LPAGIVEGRGWGVGRVPGLAFQPGYPGVYSLVGSGPDNGADHHIEMKVVYVQVFFKGEHGSYPVDRRTYDRNVEILARPWKKLKLVKRTE
jgi:hypothetical protein